MKDKEYRAIEEIEKILREYGIILERKDKHYKMRVPMPEKVSYNPLAPVKPPKDFMEFTFAIAYKKSYIPHVEMYRLKVPEEELLA